MKKFVEQIPVEGARNKILVRKREKKTTAKKLRFGRMTLGDKLEATFTMPEG